MGFNVDRIVKAVRKLHGCDGCSQQVEVGQPATVYSGVYDGDFYSAYYHPECRAAEIELNNDHGTYGDEWQMISAALDEPEDRSWLTEEHPVVAARLGITTKKPRP